MTLLGALALAVWVYLLLGHGRFWQGGPVLAPARPHACPRVGIVVPARDEAPTIAACLRSLLAQEYGGPFDLVLVDDDSRDGTGEIAHNLHESRLAIIAGARRPTGWSGKLWALQQGVAHLRAASDPPLLLFTDADIVHRPEHLATLVARMGDDLDLVSEMVALRCESIAERALVPAFVFFFQLLYPFARVNDAGSRVAAAAGGTVLVRAAALDRVGGLEAMRGALIDDVTLARRIKRDGRLFLGHSALAESRRPYPGVGDVWRMVTRTAFVQLGQSAWALAGTLAGMALVWLAPPALALFGHGPARAAGVLGWAAMSFAYAPTLRRFRLPLIWAALLPLVAAFYTAATLGSALNHWRGHGVVWKQRAYLPE